MRDDYTINYMAFNKRLYKRQLKGYNSVILATDWPESSNQDVYCLFQCEILDPAVKPRDDEKDCGMEIDAMRLREDDIR